MEPERGAGANELLLVTTNELPALQAAQRALSYLDTNRVGRWKIRLVVNRYLRDVGLSREVIGTALHAEVFETLPSDYEAVQKSLDGWQAHSAQQPVRQGRPATGGTAGRQTAACRQKGVFSVRIARAVLEDVQVDRMHSRWAEILEQPLNGLTILQDVPLARYTRFEVGGPARILADASTETALVEAMRAIRDSGEPHTVIGGGTNLVASDEGFPGVVLRYTNAGLEIEGSRVHAAAGARLQNAWSIRPSLTDCVAWRP